MGLTSSKTVSETENMSDFEFSIPDSLLIDVLSYVPPKDLLKSCRLVCKLWKNIIDGHSLWKIKCERDKIHIPSVKLETIPYHFYRTLYLFNPYGTNLMKNSCGENNLNDWLIVQNIGDGYCIEDPPKGADPVPEEVGTTRCFATSYSSCVKYQLIDLNNEGVHPEIINSPNAKIEVGEWYAARFDCASVYSLNIFLLDDKYKLPKDMYLSNFLTDDLKDNTVSQFEFEYKEQQWSGKEWKKVTHVFEDIKSTRYILFIHSGKDSQYWAGHYGSKMTGAYVKIVV